MDFPSKQRRQNSEMAIGKERAAQRRDHTSRGIATPVAHLLQTVQVTPGITNQPWHAQGIAVRGGGHILPQQQRALFHWLSLPSPESRYPWRGAIVPKQQLRSQHGE